MNTNFINEEHENQINILNNAIKNGNNKDKFLVMPFETSTGKTINTCISLAENGRSTLLVVKFNEEQQKDMDKINEFCKDNPLALAITSENYQKTKKQIKEYPVLIISHKRYLMCCQEYFYHKHIKSINNYLIPYLKQSSGENKEKIIKYLQQREELSKPRMWDYITNYYGSTRENLIIDEEINLFNLFEYGNIDRQYFDGKLPPNIAQEFQNFNKKYIEHIFDKYQGFVDNKKKIKDKNNIGFIQIYNFKDQISHKTLEDLQILKLKVMDENHINNDWRTEKKMRRNYYGNCPYEKFLDNLELLLCNEQVIMNTRGYTHSLSTATTGLFYQPLLLKNNIILDANAKYNYTYQLNQKLFEVPTFDDVVDYSNSKMIVTQERCSLNSINDRYLNAVCLKIIEEYKKDNQILVVANLKIQEKLKKLIKTLDPNIKLLIDENELENLDSDEKIVVLGHYQNMVGKNNYKNMNMAFNVASPRLPQQNYILTYAYYKGEILDNTNNYNLRAGTNEAAQFNHSDIQEISVSQQSSEIQQCLKRIARDSKINGTYFLIYDDTKVIKQVIQYFNNINIIKNDWVKEYKTKFDVIQNKYNWSNLINFFETMEPNVKYRKNYIASMCEINNLRKILIHDEIKKYLKNNKNIKIENYHIVKKAN